MQANNSSPEASGHRLVFESPEIKVVTLSSAARVCVSSPSESQGQQTQVYFRGGWEAPGSESI